MTSTAPFDDAPLKMQTAQSAPEWWRTEANKVPPAGVRVGTSTASRGRAKMPPGSADTAPRLSGAKSDRVSAVLEAANLTAQLYRLDREDKTFAAGDRVFDFFEESFEGGEQGLADCEAVLQLLDASLLSETVLVAVLAVTHSARDHLPSRRNFLDRVHERLTLTNPDEANFIVDTYR